MEWLVGFGEGTGTDAESHTHTLDGLKWWINHITEEHLEDHTNSTVGSDSGVILYTQTHINLFAEFNGK